MTQHTDALDVLANDHREVEQLFGRYEAAVTTEERTEVAREVVHHLAVHGEIEELLLYPRARLAVADGEQLVDESIGEHVAMKQTLNDIDSMRADENGFDERMQELMAEVRHHVQDEESRLFPRIRAALDHDTLQSLGEQLQTAKGIVPTRPHPGAPTGPIGKMATGAPVALVDRVRDAVRSWSERRG